MSFVDAVLEAYRLEHYGQACELFCLGCAYTPGELPFELLEAWDDIEDYVRALDKCPSDRDGLFVERLQPAFVRIQKWKDASTM